MSENLYFRDVLFWGVAQNSQNCNQKGVSKRVGFDTFLTVSKRVVFETFLIISLLGVQKTKIIR